MVRGWRATTSCPILTLVATTRRAGGSTATKLRYVVTIEREADGRFIASVPEVPGCHVYGRTRRQAVARAQRALQSASTPFAIRDAARRSNLSCRSRWSPYH